MKTREEERLFYCNKCINKKEDTRFGVLCGLTGQKPSFRDTCKDFNQNQTRNYTQKTSSTNKKAFEKEKKQKWVGATIVFTILVIGFKIARTISKLDDNNYNSSQYNYDSQKELERAQERLYKVPTINYLSETNRQASFNRKMDTDTIIIVNNKIKLHLPKGFSLSISNTDSNLPVKATSRGYYFIYNKIENKKDTDLLKQWENYRNNFINQFPESDLIIKKPITINTVTGEIDRVDFKIKNKVKTIKGTAKLVKYKNELYFFQLVSDASNADHTTISRYLRYYVKTSF